CDACRGRRYNRETLEVKFKGKSIADVLDMSVEEALEFFVKIPKLRRRLQTLHDVGLDYMRLGQPATTLSGGEAQRVKLATELSKVATGRTLYILDEPAAVPVMSVRARAVIPDGGGRVLFDRTHHFDRAPFYWLPGGGVEPGETAEEAVRRELIEEASLVIRVQRLLYISENLFVESGD